jgi:membrane fusion protein, hemolysin D
MLKERMEARKYLYEKEIGSKLTYLEVAQDLAEHEQELVQRHRLSEADNAGAAIVEQRRQAEVEYRRTVLSDMAHADQKARASRRSW